MTPVQMNSRDGVEQEWMRASQAYGTAGGVVHSRDERTNVRGASVRGANVRGTIAGASGDEPTARDGWWRRVRRMVRDAAIGLALVVAVPLGVIGVRGGDVNWYSDAGTRERAADAERLRALMLPKDPSVTPMQAGLAFHSLRSRRNVVPGIDDPRFPMRPVTTLYARPWEHRPTTIGMFPATSMGPLDNVVSASVVSFSNGFSPAEIQYLRTVAEAPIWAAVETVARAERVDVIGGAYVLPFRDDAFAPAMPILRFADTKLLAYAGVSRGAYYLAIGDTARAEAALKLIVSFGFAIMDNGTSAIDAMIGTVVASIGRDGLQQLYDMMGTAQQQALAAPLPKRSADLYAAAAARRTAPIDAAARRATAITDANNPEIPRALRFQQLSQLAFSSCGSVREVLFGPGDDVRGAFDRANGSLARLPSERAYLDLLLAAPERGDAQFEFRGRVGVLVGGAASAAAIILQQPRIASCAQLAMTRGK